MIGAFTAYASSCTTLENAQASSFQSLSSVPGSLTSFHSCALKVLITNSDSELLAPCSCVRGSQPFAWPVKAKPRELQSSFPTRCLSAALMSLAISVLLSSLILRTTVFPQASIFHREVCFTSSFADKQVSQVICCLLTWDTLPMI